jgi:DNA-binding transcriptional MerR regulator
MRTGEVLQQVDGMTKDLLYYFESKGYVKPRKIEYARVERNDYSDDDLKKIKLIWRYYSQGFRPRVAYEKAMADYNNTQLPLWQAER